VNLIGNSVYAVLAGDNPKKTITISTRTLTDEYVQIEVIDNGAGIPHDIARRIFEYGFTTKKKGHGFGLHSSANAAKEMGGKLTSYSRGVGKGATFILELPVKSAKPQEVEI
jgi:signal transduction histidine kinase